MILRDVSSVCPAYSTASPRIEASLRKGLAAAATDFVISNSSRFFDLNASILRQLRDGEQSDYGWDDR